MSFKIENHIKYLSLGVISVLLAACGGGDSSGTETTNANTVISYVGIIELEPEFETGEADFYFVEDGVAVSRLRQGFPFDADKCQVRRTDSQSREVLFDSGRYTVPYPSADLGEPMLVRVSAGDSIQIFNDSDVYSNWPLRRLDDDADYNLRVCWHDLRVRTARLKSYCLR